MIDLSESAVYTRLIQEAWDSVGTAQQLSSIQGANARLTVNPLGDYAQPWRASYLRGDLMQAAHADGLAVWGRTEFDPMPDDFTISSVQCGRKVTILARPVACPSRGRTEKE